MVIKFNVLLNSTEAYRSCIQIHRFILSILFCALLTACGGGSSSDNKDKQQIVGLSNISLQYNDTPIQNQEIRVSLVTDENVGEVDWLVASQPSMSNILLTKAVDNKSVAFTASEPGSYQITARSVSNGSEKSASFKIIQEFSFDELKIEGNDGTQSIEAIAGVITNQSWINSSALTQLELETIVAEFANLIVIGYSDTFGLLVEYDETDISNKETLEEIKTRLGIDSVRNRYHRGINSIGLDQLPPDDCSDSPMINCSGFSDGGDNWHLEQIGALQAWEYTTGSNNIVIGVSESAYDFSHDELSGRYDGVSGSRGFLETQEEFDKRRAHGNASAGSIGAVTDNKKGMSGVNWVSKMFLGKNGVRGLENILAQDNIVTINSSWGWHIADTFDPNNDDLANDRRSKSIKHVQDFRDLVDKHPKVLFVWSAGNGIGNGKGNNGVYGVNAIFGNGAIHYNENESPDPKDNVIVVAAMQRDQRLAAYSNYGDSVDLASPTAYKSLSFNGGFIEGADFSYGKTSGYTGTSAAAPIVTGVASLIYSLYPGFTGKDVKNILITSAIDDVTERNKEPGVFGSGVVDNNTKLNLPILNAEKALEKAQEIVNSKVVVNYSIPDPFSPQARLSFKSIDENLEVVGVEWELQSSPDGNSSWVFVNGMSVIGDIAETLLDTSTPFHQIIATVTLRNPDNNDEAIVKEKVKRFSYATAGITAKDNVSFSSLSNVEVGLEQIAGLPITTTGFTNSNGLVSTYLKPGTYKVRGSLDAYQEAVTSITVNGLQSLQTTLNLTSNSAGAVGSLSGIIVDGNGGAVANASVRISGGNQTNGFFASVITDAGGNYSISNISKIDSSDSPITSFILEVSASDFSPTVRGEVIVLPGKTRIENFTLTPQNLLGDITFTADSETISSGSSVNLTAVFADGTGVVDNGVGAIESGVPLSVSPTSTTTYNLTVTSSTGVTATQAVTVTVSNSSDTVITITGSGVSTLIGSEADVFTFTATKTDGGTWIDESNGVSIEIRRSWNGVHYDFSFTVKSPVAYPNWFTYNPYRGSRSQSPDGRIITVNNLQVSSIPAGTSLILNGTFQDASCLSSLICD